MVSTLRPSSFCLSSLWNPIPGIPFPGNTKSEIFRNRHVTSLRLPLQHQVWCLFGSTSLFLGSWSLTQWQTVWLPLQLRKDKTDSLAAGPAAVCHQEPWHLWIMGRTQHFSIPRLLLELSTHPFVLAHLVPFPLAHLQGDPSESIGGEGRPAIAWHSCPWNADLNGKVGTVTHFLRGRRWSAQAESTDSFTWTGHLTLPVLTSLSTVGSITPTSMVVRELNETVAVKLLAWCVHRGSCYQWAPWCFFLLPFEPLQSQHIPHLPNAWLPTCRNRQDSSFSFPPPHTSWHVWIC